MITGAYTVAGSTFGFRFDAGRLEGPADLRRWVDDVIATGLDIPAPEPMEPTAPGLRPMVTAYLTLNFALSLNADAYTLSWPEWDDVPADVKF